MRGVYLRGGWGEGITEGIDLGRFTCGQEGRSGIGTVVEVCGNRDVGSPCVCSQCVYRAIAAET